MAQLVWIFTRYDQALRSLLESNRSDHGVFLDDDLPRSKCRSSNLKYNRSCGVDRAYVLQNCITVCSPSNEIVHVLVVPDSYASFFSYCRLHPKLEGWAVKL